jgi:hypothetical protein
VEVEVCAERFHEAYKWWASAESKQTPCGLLLANKESRHVYLKQYLPIFRYVPPDVKFSKHENDRDQMIDIIDLSDSRFPLCYVDPKIDMLYLGPFNPHPIDCDRYFTNDKTPFATGPLKSLAAIPALQQLRRLGCQFGEWDEGVNGYPGMDDYNKNFLLFPSLEEFIIGVGDVGWEAMNLHKNIRLRKTKLSGQIELEEILRDEWASSDDPEGPTYFSWWWHGVRTNNSADWKAPSFSVKRVLRGGKRPQNSLTGYWDGVSPEEQRLLDELQSSTAAEESEKNEEDIEMIEDEAEEIADENLDELEDFNESADEESLEEQ